MSKLPGNLHYSAAHSTLRNFGNQSFATDGCRILIDELHPVMNDNPSPSLTNSSIRVTSSALGKNDDTVFGLARAFLSIAPMTHKKLQKLCYYAKAWYLALYDCNIIRENFQAWVHGAVQPTLYQYYKRYGFDIIPRNQSTPGIPEEFISFSHQIYDSYGDLDGNELEELNHQEKPWIEAREGCAPWERCNNTISENTMKEYYRSLIEP